MATGDFSVDLAAINSTLSSIEKVLNLADMQVQVAELEILASAPDLWDDQANAQRVTGKLSVLQADIGRIKNLRSRVDDVHVLHEMGIAESDQAILDEATAELIALEKSIGELEVRTLLSGEYDHREALVSIRSGAGGVDAADWAEMLQRMYLRYCERHGWPTEVYETSYAEEAGIKSTTFAVKAPFAYGTLSVEQTSFAEVEVIPVVEQTDSVEIPDDDIRVDVYRSSGPGGQGVNTTDSAVRLTHIPTGIVVSCQNERSQLQNKATAMAVLQARILERTRQEEQNKINALKGDTSGSWGNQMRSYVLHPYQMVKDIRTEEETGNTSAVLDGDIDSFVEAGIRWRREQAN
jgi:peptide chain release factor 2